MNQVEIIGDVHGLTLDYMTYVNILDYPSIALGDHVDGPIQRQHMSTVDPERHRIIGGNHDNYYNLMPHYLGDYGQTPFIESGFYIRGAFTPPWATTKRYPQEQLSYTELQGAMDSYVEAKPSVMLTHAPPMHMIRSWWPRLEPYKQDITAIYLTHCWEQHMPQLWVFGHMHEFKMQKIRDTVFVCLPELGVMTVTEDDDEIKITVGGELAH